MESEKRKPVAPFYAVAVLWLIFPMYTAMHYILLAVVSAVVFIAVRDICANATCSWSCKNYFVNGGMCHD